MNTFESIGSNRFRVNAFAIVLVAAWINFSEFLRNEVLFKDFWINHFLQMGLNFPSSFLNKILWGGWGLCLALFLRVVYPRFSFLKVVFLSWFVVFFMMWIALYNLNVLPLRLLFFATPLSILEIFVAVLILKFFESTFQSGN